jgi:hypothetical protein
MAVGGGQEEGGEESELAFEWRLEEVKRRVVCVRNGKCRGNVMVRAGAFNPFLRESLPAVEARHQLS